MQTIKQIIAGIIILTLLSFVFHKAMQIKPGESVGPFSINKTSLKELKNQKPLIGKGNFVIIKWHAPHCGMIYPYKKLVFKKAGISFNFTTDTPNDSSKFESIEIRKPCDAVTVKSVSVYSTRADIYNLYGKPISKETASRLEYRELEITFEFSNSEKASLTDTVAIIHVYSTAKD